MPIISTSNYKNRPWYLLNGHMETIVPSLLGYVDGVEYDRERLELVDGDFLDLDWMKSAGNTKLMVITHGLEGSADRYYVKRTAKFFHKIGWDILAWNCRSCSNEINRLPRFYHHGDTDDLSSVIDHGLSKNAYDSMVLVGYSMGGSMSLKYLGEGRVLPGAVKGAVTYSVPCSLRSSGEQLRVKGNRLYEKRFLDKLVAKVKLKGALSPEHIDLQGIDQLDDFDAFHLKYTVPLHGFDDLDDFYAKCTCDQFFSTIQQPALIVNALNDPLLGDKCYPYDLTNQNPNIYLETPKKGGHVGFTLRNDEYSYMEYRAAAFIDEKISLF